MLVILMVKKNDIKRLPKSLLLMLSNLLSSHDFKKSMWAWFSLTTVSSHPSMTTTTEKMF